MNENDHADWANIDGQAYDGLEEEKDDDSIDIRRPFNPEHIKVRTVHRVVELITSRIAHGEIELAPDFQRMAGVWDDKRKSRLIESLLLRIPIPVFYVAADKDDRWSVVDGLQRTSTIYDFIEDKFSLRRLEYLTKLNGHTFSNLPRPMQRRIRETELIINVIEPGTPQEVMFNIFRRINTGGVTLNGQEIRNALHPGPIREYLKELAGTDEFLTATNGSIRPDRMADRECILRFLAFYVEPWETYSANSLDDYLIEAMTRINEEGSTFRDDLSQIFRRSMKAASGIFHDYAFRKLYERNGRRNPISKALFETWGVGLARRSHRELDSLIKERNKVIGQFVLLMNEDHDFNTSISYATGVPSRVRKRFQAIDELIGRCLL